MSDNIEQATAAPGEKRDLQTETEAAQAVNGLHHGPQCKNCGRRERRCRCEKFEPET